MLVPEYDDFDPTTWFPIGEPTVDSSFDKELLRIAGTNPFGKPILIRRWGVTHRDEMSVSDEPKYLYVIKNPTLIGFEFKDESDELCFVKRLQDVPAKVLVPIPKYNNPKLGERRWIIEVWRSAEFLARSDRYKQTHDTGDSEITVSCRNCGSGMLLLTGREDERECVMCGSRRQSVVETREIKNERIFKDFPSEGCYDYFLRLETSQGLYRPADSEALEVIRRLWALTQMSPKQKREFYLKRREAEQKQTSIQKRERHNYIWSDDYKESIECQPS